MFGTCLEPFSELVLWCKCFGHVVQVMGVYGNKCKTKFSRKIRVCASWTDHACDHALELQSRPWPTQEQPPRPLQKEKEKKKIVQRWSRPTITLVTITCTTTTPVTRRKGRRKLVQRWSRHLITPVTNSITTTTAVRDSRDRCQATSSSSFLFHGRDHSLHYWSRPWPIFKAWSRPWSMPCLLQMFCFAFQMWFKGCVVL